MDDLSVLGNAAAIPIIIAITEFLKRNFEFKRKSEVMSLFVSFGVCLGWEIYTTPEAELISIWTGGIIPTGQHLIHLAVISCATWLSASKSYDFLLGEKRRNAQIASHIVEKENLKQQIKELRANQPAVEEDTPDAELDNKVREILEA